MTDANDPPAPSLPERFEVLAVLERSAQRIRCHARDRRFGREVELELPGPGVAALLATSRHDRERLLREARARAGVRHPGVQVLYEVDEDAPGGPLLVLEHRPGEGLDEVLARRGRLEPAEVVRIGRALAQAAQAVHAAGMVHRAIQVANVRVHPASLFADAGVAGGAPDRVVLGGFAFAKPEGGQSSIDYRVRGGGSGDDLSAALPDHPAPEQVAGHAATPRSDVFALGCVLYRCLTGRDAFEAGSLDQVEPAPCRKVLSGVPRVLDDLVMQCLRRVPSARFPSMAALDDALAAVELRLAEPGAAPVVAPARRWWLAGAGALVVLGAALLLGPFGSGARADRGRVEPVDSARGPEAVPRPGARTAGELERYTTAQALVIGIGYDGSPDHLRLRNAVADARAVHQRLLALGWPADRVELLVDPHTTRDDLERGFAQLVARAREATGSQTLLYFAGHGQRGPDPKTTEGWILPLDAARRQRGLPQGERWIAFDVLRQLFRGTEGRHVLAVFDCCFAGAGLRLLRGGDPSFGEREMREDLEHTAHIVMASSEAGQSAADGGGEHSPYCEVLLDALDRARTEPVSTFAIQAALQARFAGSATQDPLRGHVDDADDADFWFVDLATSRRGEPPRIIDSRSRQPATGR
ncbi:MAG: caspase family protein [Planctomycetes bacterium]|nr:caspase family protein [Planctomycetota bacterium]